MKTLIFTLFLYFSISGSVVVNAGSSSLTVNYPAKIGSYNNLSLQNLPGNPVCSQPNNNGMLYMNTTNNNLELCANGSPISVPYPETCFNRFFWYSCTGNGCNPNDSTCDTTNNFPGCCINTVGNSCTYSNAGGSITIANRQPSGPALGFPKGCSAFGCPGPAPIPGQSECPSGYSAAKQTVSSTVKSITDTIQTYANANTYYWVVSSVCCSTTGTSNGSPYSTVYPSS